MGKYIAEQTVKHMIQSGVSVKGAHVNVLGLTFKENCPDLRNSQGDRRDPRARELRRRPCTCTTRWPNARRPSTSTASSWCAWDDLPKADAIVAAVAHKEFRDHSHRPDARPSCANGGVYVDVKCTADAVALRARGVNVWRL